MYDIDLYADKTAGMLEFVDAPGRGRKKKQKLLRRGTKSCQFEAREDLIRTFGIHLSHEDFLTKILTSAVCEQRWG